MRKAELRTLRKLNATPAIIKRAHMTVQETDHKYVDGVYRTVTVDRPKYSALFRLQNLKFYTKIACFLPCDIKDGIMTPRYEIFVNCEGEEWITRELDKDGNEKKWLTAKVYNLDGITGWNWFWACKFWANRDALDTMMRKFRTESRKDARGIFRLATWQEEVQSRRIERRDKKEQEPWDADMALVPDVLPGFMDWMQRHAADEYYMIYDYERNGSTKGYCTCCKKDVPIRNPRHGKTYVCPSCRRKTFFKSSGKIGSLYTESKHAECVQKIDGGIVLRTFLQKQWFGASFRNPSVTMTEVRRTLIFDGGEVRNYYYGDYKNKYHRWILATRYYPYYFDRKILLYRRNVPQMKRTTILGQSAFDCWEKLPCELARYLNIEKKRPEVEKLAKIGMTTLASDFVWMNDKSGNIDRTETELAKMLRIDNARLKRLYTIVPKSACRYAHLEWLRIEKVQDTIWPDSMIRELGDDNINPSALYFLPTPINFTKSYNYLKKQGNLCDEPLTQALDTWRDYLAIAETLKMDIMNQQIQRPKNLKEAHDRLVKMSREGSMKEAAGKIEKKWPMVSAQLKKLERFEFSDGEYMIFAPKSVFDIVCEGEILSHCVHRCDYYFERITNDESYLFFLRKSKYPDMPWYTLEVEPSGNIRQKRTTGDNQNPDFLDAIEFLKKWQQFFKAQLTKRDKEFGEKSDELRRANYRKLREEQKQVWHGKLAGQLLADVLENDFMGAM